MIINLLNEMRKNEYKDWSLLHYFIFTFIILFGVGGAVCAVMSFVLVGAGITSWSVVLVSLIFAIIGLPCLFFVNNGRW